MIRDLFAAFARHAVGVIAGLLSFALVGRLLGGHALGAWAILGTLGFLLGLSDLGTSTAVQRAEVRRDPEGVRRAFGIALASVMITGPAFGALSLLGLPVPLLPASIVAVSGLCFAYGFPARAVLLVRGRLTDLAWAKSAGAAVQVSITLVALALRRDLTSPALGALAGAAVELVLVLRALRRIEPTLSLLPRYESAAALRSVLGEGAASLVLNLAVVLAVRLDLFVLGRVAPLAVVGAYGVASRAVDQSYVLAKQASAALLSRIARSEQRARVVTEGARALAVIVAAGMAALTHVGPVLLASWVGAAAIGEATYVALILLGLAATIAATHDIPASALALAGKTPWAATRAIAAGALVNVVVSIAFAPAYGAWAVASGTVVGNAVTCVWVYAALGRTKDAPSVRAIVLPALAAGLVAHGVGAVLGRFVVSFPAAVAASAVIVAAGALAALPFVLSRAPALPLLAEEAS